MISIIEAWGFEPDDWACSPHKIYSFTSESNTDSDKILKRMFTDELVKFVIINDGTNKQTYRKGWVLD
jgi:hypothetical protein